MSIALWPVFADHHDHGLVDEGAILLAAADELDTLASAAGHTPLTAFDAYASVPDEVMAERALAAEGVPDLSNLPVTWHDPADAVTTLDALMAEASREVAEALTAFREVLREAAARGTRFHLTIA